MQTDPIGYGDGMNWYNYVGSDPVNFRDPTGFEGEGNDDIIVRGCSILTYCDGNPNSRFCISGSGWSRLPGVLSLDFDLNDFINTIVVEASRKVHCPLPPVQVSVGADIYAGYGGSVAVGFSVDPTTNQWRLVAEGGLGSGFGGGYGAAIGPGEKGSGVTYHNNVTLSYEASVTMSTRVNEFGALPNSWRDYRPDSVAAGAGPKVGIWGSHIAKYTTNPTGKSYDFCEGKR